MTDSATARESMMGGEAQTSLSLAELKGAQWQAVTRFQSLYRLLGSRLLAGGSVVQVGVDEATPLSLLRGLGWKVGITSGAAQPLALVNKLYRLSPVQTIDPAEADLLLRFGIEHVDQLEEGRLGALFARGAAGGLIVLEVRIRGDAASLYSRLGQVIRVLAYLDGLPQAELIKVKPSCGNYWILARKRRDASGSIGKAPIKGLWALRAWCGLAATASLLPSMRAGLALLWQVASRLHGSELARMTIANRGKSMWMAREAKRLRRRGKLPLMHFGVHTPANAGDRVLFEAVRAAVGMSDQIDWELREIREEVTARAIDEINSSAGILIGGGGLFLIDLAASATSGWQWPCPPDLLHRIDVPIAVFAVGYNRFRGQEEFPASFAESLAILVDKSVFVGIRNRGSIEALKAYLAPGQRAKLKYQPCPTTVMNYLNMPRSTERSRRDDRPRLVINAAFDRFGMRLGGREAETLGGVADMASLAHELGWRVIVAGHLFDDEAILPFFARRGVPYELRQFTNASTAEILSFYENVDLVVGMRGHAQMIPFGLGTPILSLVAHDKMQWFLDDIGHPDWGVEFNMPDVGERLTSAFAAAAADISGRRRQIAEARRRLWTITQENLQIVRSGFGI